MERHLPTLLKTSAAVLFSLMVCVPGEGAGVRTYEDSPEIELPPVGGPVIHAKNVLEMLRMGEAEAARDGLLQHLLRNSGDSEAWRLLGLTQFRLEDYNGAARSFSTAVSRSPEPSNEDSFCQAASLVRAGRIGEGLELLQDLLKIDPDHRQARLLLVDCLKFKGRPEEAREQEKVARSQPERAASHWFPQLMLSADPEPIKNESGNSYARRDLEGVFPLSSLPEPSVLAAHPRSMNRNNSPSWVPLEFAYNLSQDAPPRAAKFPASAKPGEVFAREAVVQPVEKQMLSLHPLREITSPQALPPVSPSTPPSSSIAPQPKASAPLSLPMGGMIDEL